MVIANDSARVLWENTDASDWNLDDFEDEQLYRIREELERTHLTASHYGVVRGLSTHPNPLGVAWTVGISSGSAYDSSGRRIYSTGTNLTVNIADANKYITIRRATTSSEQRSNIISAGQTNYLRLDDSVTYHKSATTSLVTNDVKLGHINTVSGSGVIVMSSTTADNRDLWCSLVQEVEEDKLMAQKVLDTNPLNPSTAPVGVPTDHEAEHHWLMYQMARVINQTPDATNWRNTPAVSLDDVYTQAQVTTQISTHNGATTAHDGVIQEVINARGSTETLSKRLDETMDAAGNLVQGKVVEQLTGFSVDVPATITSFIKDVPLAADSVHVKLEFPTRIRIYYCRIYAATAPANDITIKLSDTGAGGSTTYTVTLTAASQSATSDAQIVFEADTELEIMTTCAGAENNRDINVFYSYTMESGV